MNQDFKLSLKIPPMLGNKSNSQPVNHNSCVRVPVNH